MTEEKAIEWLNAISVTQKNSLHESSVAERKEALHIAIQAVSEIQQYRAIGTVEEIEGLNFNRNQLRLVNLIEEYKGKLREYEEIGTPNEIRAKLCFLDTYKGADSDGRLVFILDKNGYCEELGGLHIDEIRKRCLES